MKDFAKYVKQGIGISVGVIIVSIIIGVSLYSYYNTKQASFNSHMEEIKNQKMLGEMDKIYGKSIKETTMIDKEGKYEIFYEVGVDDVLIKDSNDGLKYTMNKDDMIEIYLESGSKIEIEPGTLVKIKIIE